MRVFAAWTWVLVFVGFAIFLKASSVLVQRAGNRMPAVVQRARPGCRELLGLHLLQVTAPLPLHRHRSHYLVMTLRKAILTRGLAAQQGLGEGEMNAVSLGDHSRLLPLFPEEFKSGGVAIVVYIGKAAMKAWSASAS